jgi:hypothetical protein
VKTFPTYGVAVQFGEVAQPPDRLYLLLSLYAGPDRWLLAVGRPVSSTPAE